MKKYVRPTHLIINVCKKDSFNSTINDMIIVATWAIYSGERREAYYSEGSENDVKESLGNTIAMWTRDMTGLAEWDDAKKMAAIAFYHTDLKEREIRGIFRASGAGAYPGEPPWELQHPKEDERVLTVQKE